MAAYQSCVPSRDESNISYRDAQRQLLCQFYASLSCKVFIHIETRGKREARKTSQVCLSPFQFESALSQEPFPALLALAFFSPLHWGRFYGLSHISKDG